MNARNGLSIKDANTIEIKATEKKEQTIGKERYISDKERLEFVAQKGAKGIDEIFKDKPTEMAAFLEKHKLSKDYASYKEVEKHTPALGKLLNKLSENKYLPRWIK